MITEAAIRDRFIKCLQEVKKTESQVSIARTIGCTPEYLSALPKKKSPKLPASVIAAFCVKYHYSAIYIITGRGDRKTVAPEKTAQQLKAEDDRWHVERSWMMELIDKLLQYALDPDRMASEIAPPDNALMDLINKANKRLKKN
jgi:hypothetical protein